MIRSSALKNSGRHRPSSPADFKNFHICFLSSVKLRLVYYLFTSPYFPCQKTNLFILKEEKGLSEQSDCVRSSVWVPIELAIGILSMKASGPIAKARGAIGDRYGDVTSNQRFVALSYNLGFFFGHLVEGLAQ